MIRNLKVLLLAALAVTALGALSASAAQAARFTAPGAAAGQTTEFKILKDGTGKTAHQVFDIRKADGTGVLSITCNEAAGTGTGVGPEPTEVTVPTLAFQGACNFAGQEVEVKNTGCNFIFTAKGLLHIVNDGENVCAPGSKPLHFTNTVLNCKVEVGAQTIEGVKYHNIEGNLVTIEALELAVAYTASGSGCEYGPTKNGLFTTGNAIVEGRRGGVKVNVAWDSV